MQRDIPMLSKAKKLKIKFLWNSWIHLKIITARDKVTMTEKMEQLYWMSGWNTTTMYQCP